MPTVVAALAPGVARSLRGLGEWSWWQYIPLAPSEREEDACAASPPWCDYTPFSDFINECHPIDVERCSRAMLGPEMSEENKRALMDELQRTQQQYKELNPEGSAAYSRWLDNQWFYELDPAEVGERLEWTGYAILGAVALTALILVQRR